MYPFCTDVTGLQYMKQRLTELQSTGPETTSEVDDAGDTDVVFARNRWSPGLGSNMYL
jgi:hypothetical protein